MQTKLRDDLKQAMLARDRLKADVLRMILASITNARIAQGADLDDDAIIRVLQKESKMRTDAITLYEQAGETERSDKEKAEKAIIEGYLPTQLGDEEIKGLLQEALTSVGATGPSDMGKVMGALKPLLGGRADGSKVAVLVKNALQEIGGVK